MRGPSRMAIVALAASACGRFGFGAHGSSDSSFDGGDAPVADAAAPRVCAVDGDCGGCQRCGSEDLCVDEPIGTMSLGHRSTCFIGTGGSRWCIGEYSGLGQPVGQTFPQRIVGEDGWTELDPGWSDNNYGIRNAMIYEWGDDPPGANGPSTPGAQIIVEETLVCTLSSTGSGVCDGNALSGTWKSLTAGDEAMCGVQTDGSLWCWGTSTANDLGIAVADGTVIATPQRIGTATDWLEATTGDSESCARKVDNTVWCWGSNNSTGTNYVDVGATPTQVTTDTDWTWVAARWSHVCAGKPNGHVWCWGNDGYSDNSVMPGDLMVPLPLDYGIAFDQFVMGGHHNCASIAGVWKCWGWNAAGQLGTGDTTNLLAPATPFCAR